MEDKLGTTEAREKALAARDAVAELAATTLEMRNAALSAMARSLLDGSDAILEANAIDVAAACAKGTPAPLIDRLQLTHERIEDIASALDELIEAPDPLGICLESRILDAGIALKKVTVPLGVIAIIYEARPNVTVDAAGLCMKTGNACILRGGSMALNSNLAISSLLAHAAHEAGLPAKAIQSIEDPSHEATNELMSLHGLVDLLIPRGGASLIKNCVEHSKVPVIETGTGNCHIYLHESADMQKATCVCVNAKCSRPGVCNAAESLLVDRNVAPSLLPSVLTALASKGVVLHCDGISYAIAREAGIDSLVPAQDEDWGREYLDLEMSVRCVEGLDEAIAHINKYGTKHSEAIIAQDESACERFCALVDAAAVYSNCSTRFTDGGVFGLGAEVGISTQKLHARGPMGLAALCSYKYLLRGDGQIR